MTDFYDSVRWAMIPAGADACLYSDGRWKAPPDAAHRFRRVRWITVLGDKGSGCGDYEPGNDLFEIPGRLRTWAEGRKAGGWRARVYTDRDNFGSAHAAVGDLPNVRYWVATLDGIPKTAAELGAELRIDPGLVWAQQFAGGINAPYDTSALLGTW